MSQQSHLISNLNEMMDAYTEVEEEAIHESQSWEMQEEERVEVRVESEQPVEETKKRKREVVEAETE